MGALRTPAPSKSEKTGRRRLESSTNEVISRSLWTTTQKETELHGKLKSKSLIITTIYRSSLTDFVKQRILTSSSRGKEFMTCWSMVDPKFCPSSPNSLFQSKTP